MHCTGELVFVDLPDGLFPDKVVENEPDCDQSCVENIVEYEIGSVVDRSSRDERKGILEDEDDHRDGDEGHAKERVDDVVGYVVIPQSSVFLSEKAGQVIRGFDLDLAMSLSLLESGLEVSNEAVPSHQAHLGGGDINRVGLHIAVCLPICLGWGPHIFAARELASIPEADFLDEPVANGVVGDTGCEFEDGVEGREVDIGHQEIHAPDEELDFFGVPGEHLRSLIDVFVPLLVVGPDVLVHLVHVLLRDQGISILNGNEDLVKVYPIFEQNWSHVGAAPVDVAVLALGLSWLKLVKGVRQNFEGALELSDQLDGFVFAAGLMPLHSEEYAVPVSQRVACQESYRLFQNLDILFEVGDDEDMSREVFIAGYGLVFHDTLEFEPVVDHDCEHAEALDTIAGEDEDTEDEVGVGEVEGAQDGEDGSNKERSKDDKFVVEVVGYGTLYLLFHFQI